MTKPIEIKYQSNSPGKHWIKLKDSNDLRDRLLKNQNKEIVENMIKLNLKIAESEGEYQIINSFLRKQIEDNKK